MTKKKKNGDKDSPASHRPYHRDPTTGRRPD